MKPRIPATHGERPWPQTLREFEELVEEFQHPLVRYAHCRLGSLADAEDVVQDVLLRAYRDREQRKGISDAGPYLYRMTANRCTDLLRGRRGQPLTDCAAGEEMTAGPAEAALRARRMRELLGGLPEREAEVIRLRVFSELPFDAIARIAGRPVATVKSRFRYGIRKLRKVLTAGGRRL